MPPKADPIQPEAEPEAQPSAPATGTRTLDQTLPSERVTPPENQVFGGNFAGLVVDPKGPDHSVSAPASINDPVEPKPEPAAAEETDDDEG